MVCEPEAVDAVRREIAELIRGLRFGTKRRLG